MKRFLIAASLTVSALLTGTANAQPPTTDCVVEQIHSGAVNFHFLCTGQWYGFNKDEVGHTAVVVSAYPGGHIQPETTGGTVSCNPDICQSSAVPEVKNLNRSFFSN